ncbi:putative 3-demethylubiquinone-9 3-methyltransferase (glyoxalase superfamily) [Actinocorallia herbida]|uniref:Putative 3-demethylubiquinone-9 3-methyltransferase (Glyoxalase superfamily) n=1 Tax=Actinocorallia herbida TaxID=58109 RepID=A0A3N1D8W6_9ACTN|nr:VOC family protein [Actinocorallia herbida]ROO89987.1 putative 3-demethylubiquinone-9 3-methyltransferase (glyoxalase superfamily) [Actinocorallia herbida]
MRVKPFLMFEGRAEEAMDLYVSLFPGSEIVWIKRYGPEGPGPEGSVFQAVFRVADQEVMCIDSYAEHGFTFTPSWSLYVECDSAEELTRIGAALEEGGSALMPVGSYGFSELFTWVADRFGVSWQLNYQGDAAT